MSSRNYSELWGKVIAIGIVLTMLFSTGFVFSNSATAELFEQVDDSTPPIPPFMIWGTIFDENNVPVLGASVTIENIRTGELLNADVYENGAYDAELERLQYGYSIGDDIEITATIGENIASKTIVVKQIGFGERVDVHFGESNAFVPNENDLALYNTVSSKSIESNMILDKADTYPPESRTSENSQTIFIDSPMSTIEEPEPEISLTDIRCPPYFRLAFTEKENNIRMTLKNDGQERKIIIVDIYHIEPDGITESFLRTVHFGTIMPGQIKTQDAWEKCANMWTPTQKGRNWIRGEIYIKEMTNERICVNEFKESFNVVPGWRPVMHIQGDWNINEPTSILNRTIIVDGNVNVNANLYLDYGTLFAGDLNVSATKTIGANEDIDLWCNYSGQYKVEVRPTGTLNIYGKLWNNDQDNHYWFYMNGTLNIGRESPPDPPGIVENVMGSPDLSQPGGIICRSDNVRIENGAEVRYGKTHGVWLEGSNANISGAKIHNNGGNGIVCRAGAEPWIEGCEISWNEKSGIDADGANPTIIHNNPIQWNRVNGININNAETEDLLIDGNNIDNNFGSGIWCNNVNATIVDNTISSNGMGLIHREDAEIISGWTSTGLWHRSCSESGEYNLSHDGSWSWWCGDNATGDYSSGPLINNLVSPTLNLNNITPIVKISSASLTFWSWYETNTQETDYDKRMIIIQSITDGTSRTIQLYGDNMKEWTRYILNISDFVGDEIRIRFSFMRNDTDNNYRGWYVDDIEVIGSYPGIWGCGIDIEGNLECNIIHNTITLNNWHGICSNGNSLISIENCIIQRNRGSGVQIISADNINPYESPKYTPGSDLGYYVWQDDHAWHVRWSSDFVIHSFEGSIKYGGDIASFITAIDLDVTDWFDINENVIQFVAEEDTAEEGFDIPLESGYLIIDFSIDGIRQTNRTFIGILSRTPGMYPFTIRLSNIVEHCTIDGSLTAVFCYPNTRIVHNEISDSTIGVMPFSQVDSNSIFISLNTFNNCTKAVYDPRMQVRIEGNQIENCGFAVWGGCGGSVGCYFINNTVLNISEFGIWIDNALECVIENNSFTNCKYGIYLMDESGPWIIKNNTLVNISDLGISVHDVYYCHPYTDISYNYLENIHNNYGISVFLHMAGRITNNTLINSTFGGILILNNYPLLCEKNILVSYNQTSTNGIYVRASSCAVRIIDNRIEGFIKGINTTECNSRTIISGNYIHNNTYGVVSEKSSIDIFQNVISNCQEGIYSMNEPDPVTITTYPNGQDTQTILFSQDGGSSIPTLNLPPNAKITFASMNVCYNFAYLKKVEGVSNIIESADFNNDGYDDILTRTFANTYPPGWAVKYYENDQNGCFIDRGIVSPSTFNMQGISAGDFNSDGSMDFLMANLNSEILFIMGDGNGHFINNGIAIKDSNIGYGFTIHSCDFNMDGTEDCLVLSVNQTTGLTEMRLYSNDGSGVFSFSRSINMYTTSCTLGFVVGDYNMDGAQDFICVNGTSFELFTNDGTGNYIQSSIYDCGMIPEKYSSLDLFDDGIPDIIASYRGGTGCYIGYINDGTGNFRANAQFTDASYYGINGIYPGHFDGDTYSDFITQTFDYTVISMFSTAPSNNLTLDIGADGLVEWQCPGIFTTEMTLNETSSPILKDCLQQYYDMIAPNKDMDVSIPLLFASESLGAITLSNLKITCVPIMLIAENNVVNNSLVGIHVNRSSPLILNSTIINSELTDMVLDDNSHPIALNSTFSDTKVLFIDSFSTLTVQWFLDVNVIYPNGCSVSDADVLVKDVCGSDISSTTTSQDGRSRWIRITDYVQTQTNITYYTPHNITASDGFVSGWAEAYVNKNMEVTVVIGAGQGFSMPLLQGWNLISLPLVPQDMDADNIPCALKSITGKWEVIKWYDPTDISDPWKTYRVGGTANDLFHIDHTMSFWIYITEPDVTFIAFGSDPSSTSIPLHEGWNMVGYPSFCGTMTVAIAFWGTGADSVEVFDPDSPSLLREVGPTYVMRPGEGYYVHVPADSVWIVDW